MPSILTQQEIFNKASSYLRTYGNPFGSQISRGWGWVNPKNPKDRCAIASFIKGNTQTEVVNNLKLACDIEDKSDIFDKFPIIGALVFVFDLESDLCNDKLKLENKLQELAASFNLKYTSPTIKDFLTVGNTKETVVE